MLTLGAGSLGVRVLAPSWSAPALPVAGADGLSPAGLQFTRPSSRASAALLAVVTSVLTMAALTGQRKAARSGLALLAVSAMILLAAASWTDAALFS